MIEPAAVCAAARKLIGTPYQHQARQAGRGVDCIGVVILVGREIKCFAPNFDATNYSRDPHDGMLLRVMDSHLQRMKGPTVGGIFVMRWFSEPQHVGVIVDPMNVVHAYGQVGRCVEHSYSAAFQKRSVAFYAFPGVDYPANLLLAPVSADLKTPFSTEKY